MKLNEIYFKSLKKSFPTVNEGFRFKYYDKINSLTCIVGKNGIGKTRFLNSILQNRAGVDLLFNDGTIKFGIEKSPNVRPYFNVDRKSVRYINNSFAIIKYSSAIEYGPIRENVIGHDVSTSYLLQKMSLSGLNRYDVINQIAVVAKKLEKISELINFNNKKIKVCLSDEGEAIYSLKDKYFNSYLFENAKDLFETHNKYKGVLRKKFISILFDELLVSDSLNSLKEELNEDPIKVLFNEINSTNFSVTKKFYELLSEITSDIFTTQVKKFFEVYSLITDNSNDFLKSGRIFKLHSEDDLNTINSVIEFFYPETNLEDCNILYEVFSVLSFSWDGLSSGEMSILNLLGRLYSGKKIYGNIPNKLLLIDEVDLGLHPEWQRLWISDVLPLISEILCSDDQELQVIITTHSPIILSDILNQDIIYLGDGELQEKTFGQNIYTLFNNSFFLDDVQGKFVSDKLAYISNFLNELSSKRQFELTKENCNKLREILGVSNTGEINNISEFKEILHSLIDSIGEEILRNYFWYLFHEINFYPEKRQSEIEKL
ncbi:MULTISPECIES: AAA family ATPase [Streptococcus]|uniref:AAA family ATPase n=1 Tax=Streptococcus TaxID=1301 RepID=UPI00352BE7C8